jgi:hypothetical protein
LAKSDLGDQSGWCMILRLGEVGKSSSFCPDLRHDPG